MSLSQHRDVLHCVPVDWDTERSDIMELPKDPAILLSYINTKLRDDYPDLEELCASLSVSQEELEKKLAAIDYRYDRKQNQFK